jgi:hypothetical protein
MIAQDAPNKPFRMATLEASVTGFPLDDFVDPATGTLHPFFENSVHIGALTNLNQHWRVGLNYNYLWTQFRKQQMGTFFIAGLDVRYERNIFDRFNLYADVLLQTGNFCSCLKDVRNPNEFPYKKDHIWYGGIGFGGTYAIYKSLRINLAFNRYVILGSKVYTYDYTQPILGLQWYIQ